MYWTTHIVKIKQNILLSEVQYREEKPLHISISKRVCSEALNIKDLYPQWGSASVGLTHELYVIYYMQVYITLKYPQNNQLINPPI